MPTREPPKRFVWRDVVAMTAVLVGLLLVASSFVWPKVSTRGTGWSDELATQYQAASAKVHELSIRAANTSPENQTRALRDDLAKAQSEYGALRAELDAARARPARIAAVLFYMGIAAAVVGVILLGTKRNT